MPENKIKTIDEEVAVDKVVNFVRNAADTNDIAHLLSKYVLDGVIQVGCSDFYKNGEVYEFPDNSV